MPDVPSPSSSSAGHGPLDAMDNMSEEEIRLRRLHKLSRILGERVPADLIFGSANEFYPGYDKNQKANGGAGAGAGGGQTMIEKAAKFGRRASVSLSTFTGFGATSTSEPPPLPSATRLQQQQQQPQQPAQGQASLAIPYQLPRPVKIDPANYRTAVLRDSVALSPTSPTFSGSQSQQRPASPAHSMATTASKYSDDGHTSSANNRPSTGSGPASRPSLGRTRSLNTGAKGFHRSRPSDVSDLVDADDYDYDAVSIPARPETPFMNAAVPIPSRDEEYDPYGEATMSVSMGGGKGEWSGQWNNNDMGAVISKLRKLK
jgi:hypothetical protein